MASFTALAKRWAVLAVLTLVGIIVAGLEAKGYISADMATTINATLIPVAGAAKSPMAK